MADDVKTANPFEPPEVDVSVTDAQDVGGLVAIVRRWEVYRLYYNVLVLASGLAGVLPLPTVLLRPLTVVAIALWAVGANVLFMIGPACDLYLARYGITHPWPRRLLFLLGTFFAMCFTFSVSLWETLALAGFNAD